MIGGLVIEAWGTQTLLWTYYTAERPPLWIIPAWPIASLTIDRLARLADRLLPESCYPLVGEAVLADLPGLLPADAGFHLADAGQIPDLDGAVDLRRADPGTRRPAADDAQLHRGGRAGLFPGALGHDPRVLDVLHAADPAAVCGAGARPGGGGLLAGTRGDGGGIEGMDRAEAADQHRWGRIRNWRGDELLQIEKHFFLHQNGRFRMV